MSKTAIGNSLATYVVRHADDNVVLGQRLAEYIASAPDLEEDLAIANFALDHIGVATYLLTYAAEIEGGHRDADAIAMFRSEREYSNLLLVEQPQSGFNDVIVRQWLFDAYQLLLWQALSGSGDGTLAGIAQRAAKEATYHLRHSSGWVVRLGDGTQESRDRVQGSVDRLWRYTDELFAMDEVDVEMTERGIGVDLAELALQWEASVDATLESAMLTRPEDSFQTSGGRQGIHTEHLGKMLAEMQWMQRSYPGLSW
jgi:ring-1,2-phenylacetyl-CoA epoxidase subunit PaaC